MAGLVAFWMPIGVGSRLAEGAHGGSEGQAAVCTRVCKCASMCAPQTRAVYTHIRLTCVCVCVYRVTHADPAADQDYLFNRDYCVGRRG